MSNISFLYGVVESTNKILCMSNQISGCLFGERGKIEYTWKEPLSIEENQQTQLGIEFRFKSRLDHCATLTPQVFKNHSFLFCFRCTSSLSDHLDSMNDKLTALEIDRVADHLRWKSSCPVQIHKMFSNWVPLFFERQSASKSLFSHDEGNASPGIQLFNQDTCEFVTISWALCGCHQTTTTTTNKLTEGYT